MKEAWRLKVTIILSCKQYSNVHLQKIEIGQAFSFIQSDFKSLGGGWGWRGDGSPGHPVPHSPRQPRYEWDHFDHGNLLIKNHYAL